MASRTTRRSEWKKTATGTWSCSLGERGLRVRLFQKTKDGMYYRAVWQPGIGVDRRPLGTCDRAEARRLGELLLCELRRGNSLAAVGPLPLGEVWERYRRDCRAFLDNGERTRREDARRAEVLLGYFSERRDVRTLSADDVARFSAARRAGGVVRRDGEVTRPVRARSVEADLVLLSTVLQWATTVRVNGGGFWLEHNPLRGVRREREKNPHRPIATMERYRRTREALQSLASAANNDNERARWLKVELALVLAEATGRRLGSIRALRWEDLDLARGFVHWRAEADKKRVGWDVPLPTGLADELRAFRQRMGAIGGLVFAAESNPSTPMDRHLFSRWLQAAEERAGLPKLEGGLWHPYRRKWATERKDRPHVDVAAAGGWKDIGTLMSCYQRPDAATLRAVMDEERKMFDAGLAVAGA